MNENIVAIDLFNISLHNLLRIYNSESESLRKDAFQNIDGRPLKNKDEIISFLKDLDLIEIEKDPELFFLTPETYDLIESGEIEYHLQNALGLEEIEDQYEDSNQPRKGFNYEVIEPDTKKPKSPFLYRAPKYLILAAYAVIGYLIYATIYFFNGSPSNDNLPPENHEILKEFIRIKENRDTLYIDEKQY